MAAGAVDAHAGEAVIPQHLEMLGNRRLADRELVAHDLDDLAGGALATAEHLEGAPPHRVAEYLEGVHV